MKKNNITLPTVAIVTVAMAALLASAAIASYNANDVSATKRGDSNSQSSAGNNDCPSELLSVIIGIQLQTSASCLNDLNSVQDSDGASIASTPFNAAPSQAIDIELGERTPVPPAPPQTASLTVVKQVECSDEIIDLDLCQPEAYTMNVDANNPDPSSFQGSDAGTTVSLEPGPYDVTEEFPAPPAGVVVTRDLSPGCSGNIESGQELTCTVTNNVDRRIL
jgi:hypothetical protein